MISKTYIARSLRTLNVAYNAPENRKYAVYFSKLAVLELCGWVEMSIDDLILRHSTRRIKDPDNIKTVENFVKKNSGFNYERNFRFLLMRLLGVVDLEQFEMHIDNFKQTKMKVEMENLSKLRNILAHTYIKGTTFTIDAPSITISRYEVIYAGLANYEECLRTV